MAGESKLASKWKAVQGENHWLGLLDPLDEELCEQLIRYGQFVEAVYNAFIGETLSKLVGQSRYGKSELFDKVYAEPGYKIHKFIYCTTLLESLTGKVVETIHSFSGTATSWFGYVAVSDDEESKKIGRRDILVVFRGTLQDIEWANNLLNFFQGTPSPTSPFESMGNLAPLELEAKSEVPTPTAPSSGPVFGLLGGIASVVKTALPWTKVTIGNRWLVPYTSVNDKDESGFGKTSARTQVMKALKTLLDRHKDEEISITVTGHSLGAALATVCAYDIANEKKNRNPSTGAVIPVTGFVFASPRVGNLEFRAAVKNVEGLRILRIGNILDVVPKVPPLTWGYVHTEEELVLNTPDSPHLKFPTVQIADFHNLQVHLHLIDYKCDHGLKHHQLELVNKSSDALKNPTVPAAWWVVQNKDVLKEANGKWVLRSHEISAADEEFN